MLNDLQIELSESFSCGIPEARAALLRNPWLLIPDLNADWLSKGYQGVYQHFELTDLLTSEFAIYSILQGKLYLQCVRLGSPNAQILEAGKLSEEFSTNLAIVNDWCEFDLSELQFYPETFPINQAALSVRLIIGRSDVYSEAEQQSVAAFRSRSVRIRSYDWLIQKAGRFSEKEIAVFSEWGPPREMDEFRSRLPRIKELLLGPTPPYFR